MTQTDTDWEARCRLARECGSLMHQLAAAQDHIAHLSNRRIEANPAYLPIESTWHRVPVIVECEIDEATGDGWNEPRYDAMATPMWVWIGGVRVNADHFGAEQNDRWADEALAQIKEGIEA